jgi:nitrile hydratase
MNTLKAATPAAQAAAVKSAMLENGHLSEAAFDAAHAIEQSLDWHNGAKVVARAWYDPAFKTRLMQDGTAACAELGFAGPEGEYIVVIEDTPEQKNVVVCTQCSCTAWPVLGLPPEWYKSPAYRARVVLEPRKVLSEMGLDLDGDVALRIWDTTAETRYLVLPLRPTGTEDWSEEQLAAIVTRESMIGVALVSARQ